ncbi:MAG: tripartite tricarboxylate transporter substrate binding protein [Burkholderiales bacterium]|nr:tripartite tricarboxylate transporter substrate binding protein [Burkholderiales bacterium]
MKFKTFRSAVAGVLALTGMVGSDALLAQQYPTKPIRVVVPFAPGGGADVLARLLAKPMQAKLNQMLVVDNRAGAGGLLGAQIVAGSAPDGYTILLATASLAVNTSLLANVRFDPIKSLAPVSWLASGPLVLVAHPSVPANSLKELIALAKNRAGGMNAGSNGAGTTSHLSIEMLRQMTGIEIAHVPYKGGGPAITGAVSGEVDILFATAPSAKPHLSTRRLKGIAITTANKSPAFPDLPTVGSVLPGFESNNWYAVFAQVNAPKEIVTKLSEEFSQATKAPEVLSFMAKDGIDPVGSSPAVLGSYFKNEVIKYSDVIKRGNVRAN